MRPLKAFTRLIRTTRFMMLASLCAGIVVGMGVFIFVYAKGYSYMSNDPKACANCHVMQQHFDSWTRSSHHSIAACNDCHTPHQPVEKYLAKARNGFNHSKAFTLQNFPQPIRITRQNLEDLQHNCIECHATLVGDIASHRDVGHGQARCTECHRSVGHMSLD